MDPLIGHVKTRAAGLETGSGEEEGEGLGIEVTAGEGEAVTTGLGEELAEGFGEAVTLGVVVVLGLGEAEVSAAEPLTGWSSLLSKAPLTLRIR